jgi:hypothetical protein
MEIEPDLVAGEPRATLREALASIRTERLADGSLDLSGDIAAELAESLLRALDRVAAELVADDERRGGEVRAGGRLQADAFVALLLRVTDPGPRPPAQP